jgi:hypothetical protein
VSKSHPEQWTIREGVERPDRSLVTALREFDTVGAPLRHLAGDAADCGATRRSGAPQPT